MTELHKNISFSRYQAFIQMNKSVFSVSKMKNIHEHVHAFQF